MKLFPSGVCEALDVYRYYTTMCDYEDLIA